MPLFQRLKPLLGELSGAVPVALSADLPAFPDSQQNPVRYRNLLKELKAALEQKHRGPDQRRCSSLSSGSLDDDDFWAHPQDGIAVFGAPGFFHVEKVQRPVPEMVVVNDHLYLKPLVRVFQSEDTYQILALDREEIKLYQGNRYVLDEIVMAPSVPRTIEEALGPNGDAAGHREERHARRRAAPASRGQARFTATARRRTSCGSTSSASSASSTARSPKRIRSLRTLPLILAALPEYHTPLPRDQPQSVPARRGIHKNADAMKPEEAARRGVACHGAALPRAARSSCSTSYHARKARGLATDDLTHAVEFATDGRVGTLLVEADRRIPGHVEGRMPRRADRDEPGGGRHPRRSRRARAENRRAGDRRAARQHADRDRARGDLPLLRQGDHAYRPPLSRRERRDSSL